jgi:hypothetical protein
MLLRFAPPAVAIALLAACGRAGAGAFPSAEPDAEATPDDGGLASDSSPAQSAPDDGGLHLMVPDGGPGLGGDGGATACSFGSAASIATSQNLNLFGQIVYYEDGGSFPPGHYRATYTDGCMKYDYLQGWTVQGDAPDAAGGFWLVGSSTTDLIVKTPGTVGIFPGAGAYSTFDDCVNANLAMDTPVDFMFDGGPIGVWLDDNPYLDNVAGDNGRNPAWSLLLLQACPPNLGHPVVQ